MNTSIILQHFETGFWAKFWLWLSVAEEVVYYNSAELMSQRVIDLQTRSKHFEAAAAKTAPKQK